MYDNQTGEYIKSYNSQGEIEAEYHLYRGAVGDILKGQGKGKILISRTKYDKYPIENVPAVETKESNQIKPVNMLSEDDLRKKHDMFFMIQHFIAAIPTGKYIDEPTMLRQLSLVGKPRYREALSRPELKDNRGRVDGVIYYGSVVSIKKLKQEGVLQ